MPGSTTGPSALEEFKARMVRVYEALMVSGEQARDQSQFPVANVAYQAAANAASMIYGTIMNAPSEQGNEGLQNLGVDIDEEDEEETTDDDDI